MNWLIENKEWFFSGAGIVIITLIYNLIFKKNKTEQNNPKINNTNNIISVELSSSDNIPKNDLNSEINQNDIKTKKRFIKILFIDDDTKFKIIDILNTAGWSTKIVKDINNIDSELILQTHLFFVDINGVGKKLSFKDEGLGLANAIKNKYPEKKVVIYSSDEKGNRFHNALRNVDDFLPKNAEPIEFQGVIEQLVMNIIK